MKIISEHVKRSLYSSFQADPLNLVLFWNMEGYCIKVSPKTLVFYKEILHSIKAFMQKTKYIYKLGERSHR